jgi:hypothetical protein
VGSRGCEAWGTTASAGSNASISQPLGFGIEAKPDCQVSGACHESPLIVVLSSLAHEVGRVRKGAAAVPPAQAISLLVRQLPRSASWPASAGAPQRVNLIAPIGITCEASSMLAVIP